MKKVTYSQSLKSSIELLEQKRADDLLQVKAQLLISLESMKPANIIKETVRDLTTDADFNGDIVKAAISIASGHITKKIVVGETHNPIKQLFGTLLQMGVTKAVSKNSDGLKSSLLSIFQTFFAKKGNPSE